MNKFLDELRALDINDIGRWPFIFRAIAIALIFSIVSAGAIYYTVVKQKLPVLEAAELQETKLRRF